MVLKSRPDKDNFKGLIFLGLQVVVILLIHLTPYKNVTL